MDKMTSIADYMTKEVNIENLVIAKGFSDCVAVVNGTGVDVIVKSTGLLPNEVAQIRDIVIEQTGATVEDIRIIEHE
jgi:stage III sporulation protein AH